MLIKSNNFVVANWVETYYHLFFPVKQPFIVASLVEPYYHFFLSSSLQVRIHIFLSEQVGYPRFELWLMHITLHVPANWVMLLGTLSSSYLTYIISNVFTILYGKKLSTYIFLTVILIYSMNLYSINIQWSILKKIYKMKQLFYPQ